MRPSARRLVAAVCLAALAVPLTACDGDSAPAAAPASADAVGADAGASADAVGADDPQSDETYAEEPGDAVDALLADLAATAAEPVGATFAGTVTTSGAFAAAIALDGAVDLTGTPDLRATLGIAGGEVEVRAVDGVVYARGLGALLGGGDADAWTSLDPAVLAGMGLPLGDLLGGLDPQAVTDTVTGLVESGAVAVTGGDGTYDVTVDTAAVSDLLSPGAGGGLGAFGPDLEGSEVVATLAFDDEQRLREVDLVVTGADGAEQLGVDLELDGWGVPQVVEAPASSTPLTDLFPSLAALGA